MSLSSRTEESGLRGSGCLVEGGGDKQRETEGKLRGSVDIRIFCDTSIAPEEAGRVQERLRPQGAHSARE